ncbi:hypothetical protein GCM10010341_76760 [Streptomyces noursei]|nr:hypothetical protein GCM10010341_76760 [Streptomyces noursei]
MPDATWKLLPDTAKEAANAPWAIAVASAPTARTAGTATAAVFFQAVRPSGAVPFGVLTASSPGQRSNARGKCFMELSAGGPPQSGKAQMTFCHTAQKSWQLETRADFE